MKTAIKAFFAVVMMVHCSSSQAVNWKSLSDDRPNMVQFSFGADNAIAAQVSYGRSFHLVIPMVFSADVSLPMGKDPFDDFRARFGLQVELVEFSGFSASLRFLSTMRRFENRFASMYGFGRDAGFIGGYYAPCWFAAGEVGFDESSETYIQHSAVMRTYYPLIRDGWYSGTGGHYYYGIMTGGTLWESFDLSLRLGAIAAQANERNATLPVYLQIGVGTRF